MPKFSRRSLEQLETCHRDLQLVAYDAIKLLDFSVTEGHRSKEKQNEYYMNGTSKLKYPASKHNRWPSEAFDLLPFPVLYGHPSDFVKDIYRQRQLDLIRVVMHVADLLGVKLRSGSDWNLNGDMTDESFLDLAHFELLSTRASIPTDVESVEEGANGSISVAASSKNLP